MKKKYIILDENNIVLGYELHDSLVDDWSDLARETVSNNGLVTTISDDLEPEIGTVYKHEIE
jgi:hypothetical protein